MKDLNKRFSNLPSIYLWYFFKSLESDGLASIEGEDAVKLTLKGKLVADRIAVEFLELALSRITHRMCVNKE